ncbi:hypothetical protein [Candidatus Nitrosocosmicus sp. SS]|jgi:hypothetical protein|nr:hypothetical protein [Candidatus Nitrosocosmicus sp. SS]
MFKANWECEVSMKEKELTLKEEMNREIENFKEIPPWLKIYKKDKPKE